jgi:hypothetical protein
MNHSEFIFESRQLLKQITSQRDWLICHNKSHVPYSYAIREINNLQYAITKIQDAALMKQYLERKHNDLKVLISSKNKSYIRRLNQLITTDISN